MDALLKLQTPEEAYRFLEDVLTVQELKSITQRLEVAVMLRRKVTYQEIAHQTGASTATISRVNPRPAVRRGRLHAGAGPARGTTEVKVEDRIA